MFEIGSSLREARFRQQLDVRDAEQATKIRTKYLKALEDEQFDLLPAETYVRGFLRTYADFLGLDGQLYVDEYNSRYVAGEEEQHPLKPRRTAMRPPRRRREGGMVLVALGSIALVTALVIVAWRFGGGTEGDPEIPGLERARPGVTTPAPATPRASTGATRLLVTAVDGDTFLEAHAGSQTGRALYRGTLERGQKQLFTADRVWVNIGIPENVRLQLNGKRVRLLGRGVPTIVIATPTGVTPASTAR